MEGDFKDWFSGNSIKDDGFRPLTLHMKTYGLPATAAEASKLGQNRIMEMLHGRIDQYGPTIGSDGKVLPPIYEEGHFTYGTGFSAS